MGNVVQVGGEEEDAVESGAVLRGEDAVKVTLLGHIKEGLVEMRRNLHQLRICAEDAVVAETVALAHETRVVNHHLHHKVGHIVVGDDVERPLGEVRRIVQRAVEDVAVAAIATSHQDAESDGSCGGIGVITGQSHKVVVGGHGIEMHLQVPLLGRAAPAVIAEERHSRQAVGYSHNLSALRCASGNEGKKHQYYRQRVFHHF